MDNRRRLFAPFGQFACCFKSFWSIDILLVRNVPSTNEVLEDLEVDR